MFDNVINTKTVANTSLSVVYAPGVIIDSIALIDVDSYVVTVEITDGVGGPVVYQNTAGLTGAESYSWYDYFFNDPLLKRTQIVFQNIPPYVNAQISITFISEIGVDVSVGQVTMGSISSLGTTQYGVSAGIIDYSVKETDEFGNTVFVQRPFSKRINATFNLNNNQLNRVQNYLYSIRAIPAVWIVTDDPQFEEAAIIFGFYRDFSTDISYPTFSQCSIELESLT